MKELIPKDWAAILQNETSLEYFSELEEFLESEWKKESVFPPEEEIFTALRLTAFSDVKIVILGQDPYHDDNQAHGLAFSVRKGVKLPPSLRNIYKELKEDLGIEPSRSGNLENWAKQGILLINTILTVRAHQANSHANRGWEKFTDALLKEINKKKDPVIFVLWGGNAAKKIPLINSDRHVIISTAHPSPLSAYRGFFGSAPFSKINEIMKKNKNQPIDWKIPSSEDDMPLFEFNQSPEMLKIH